MMRSFLIVSILLIISLYSKGQDLVLASGNVFLSVEFIEESDSTIKYHAIIKNGNTNSIYIYEESLKQIERSNYLGIGLYSCSETYNPKSEGIKLTELTSNEQRVYKGKLVFDNTKDLKIAIDYSKLDKYKRKNEPIGVVDLKEYNSGVQQVSVSFKTLNLNFE